MNEMSHASSVSTVNRDGDKALILAVDDDRVLLMMLEQKLRAS